MGKTIAVMAGNYREFERCVRSLQEEGTTFVYADHADRIRGYRFDGYKVVGTFWERGDADKMHNLVLTRMQNDPRAKPLKQTK